jgi:hypothetical protein
MPAPKHLLTMIAAWLAVGSHACEGAVPRYQPAVEPALLSGPWPAFWITHPGPVNHDFVVYRLRKAFQLQARPDRFVVHVSGDCRYRLFVNGISACSGPQRSYPMAWRFDSVDIAPLLQAGRNVLAAVVWNYGDDRPYALITVRTAFILQGDSEAENIADTDGTWRILQDPAVTAVPIDQAALHTFIVVGPGEAVDGRAFPWGWTAASYDDSSWLPAQALGHGMPQGTGTDIAWWLAPRSIPPMDETPQRLARVRRAEGVAVGDSLLAGRGAVSIPANREATLLLDQGFETNAFPHVVTSGGRGSVLTLTYAEALVDSAGQKGPRDEVAGRRILGKEDVFTADGGTGRDFTTLAFRTYRYLQVKVRTADQPISIMDIRGLATGYPFRQEATFDSDDPGLGKIWEVGWRTARLCAYETYTDCPYYEQQQYIGDTRIQALISLAVSGDDRLMRNAIELFDNSRLPDGLTLSRYPAIYPQIIPTFSLFWVQMVHDFYLYRRDDGFVRDRLDGIRGVLDWFERRVDPGTGMLGPVPYWCFVDWPDDWPWIDDAHPGGQAPCAHTGGSAILTLQFAWTLDNAAELFSAYGRPAEAAHCAALARSLRSATVERCWDGERKLMADSPARRSYSQHANALAVLSGAVGGEEAAGLMRRVIHDRDLTQCTPYFRFYLLRAMKAAGLGDDYVSELQPWREMLARGLTTFAERPDPTRSDCHAWSASPDYELIATVCGIEPASPGFGTVRIEPHLGPLKRVRGSAPHPNGPISVSFTRDGDRLEADVTLPPGLPGVLAWKGREAVLHEGPQHLALGP